MEGKVLCIHGIAGIGKSQLLAHKTQQLLDSGRSALLLVAGIYFTDSPIREQIMKNLQLDCSFEDLVDILEVRRRRTENSPCCAVRSQRTIRRSRSRIGM